MDIRLLDKADIGAAKALWKQAFGDSDAFIDTYFRNKILPGQSLGLFDGALISVVHMLPFTVRVQGRDMPTAFIAGAATARDRRGEGHMRTLLFESLKLMRARGILMMHLYPFRHSFYEKFGWATYSYVHKKTLTQADGHAAADVVAAHDAAVLRPLYEAMMGACDGYIVRGEREWRWRLEELFSDGGSVVVLLKNNAPAAYMMYYLADGNAEAIETVYTDEADAAALAGHLLSAGAREVHYNLAAQSIGTESGKAVPHGMARVVDAGALLEAFGAVKMLDDVSITDDFAPWNNIGRPGVKNMTSGQLAQYIHQGHFLHKHNDAMRKTSYNEGDYFSLRQTCIFEEY
jgi:predicted acetyltransferase